MKEDAIGRIDRETHHAYMRAVGLAERFNKARIQGKVPEDFMHFAPRVLVRAFALALGPDFSFQDGVVYNLSTDSECRHGVPTKLLLNTSDRIMEVKTWEIDHSWLTLCGYDVWVDLYPPGADPRWLAPTKYQSSLFRPAYVATGLKKGVMIDHAEVIAFADVLKGLSNKSTRKRVAKS
jgi:hypothetical protein